VNYLIKLCDGLGILRSEIDYHVLTEQRSSRAELRKESHRVGMQQWATSDLNRVFGADDRVLQARGWDTCIWIYRVPRQSRNFNIARALLHNFWSQRALSSPLYLPPPLPLLRQGGIPPRLASIAARPALSIS